MQHGSVMEDQGNEIEQATYKEVNEYLNGFMVCITKMVYFGKKEHVWQTLIVSVCIGFVLVLAK